jgi:hypothetical protein
VHGRLHVSAVSGNRNTLIRKKKLNDVICDGDEQEKRSVVYSTHVHSIVHAVL